MGEVDQKLHAFLRANAGVVTRSEALALGMSPATLTRWVRRGHLVAANRGTYLLPGVLEQERTLLRAATRALDAVVSHESAARLHGLDGLDPARITITVPVRRSNRFEAVIVHQSTDLTPDDTTHILGLPVTDPPRTILDLAAVLPPVLLVACLDQAVRMRLTTYEKTADRLERIARQGKPGVKKLRRILKPRLGGNFVSESTLETRTLKALGRLRRPPARYAIQTELAAPCQWSGRHVVRHRENRHRGRQSAVPRDSRGFSNRPDQGQPRPDCGLDYPPLHLGGHHQAAGIRGLNRRQGHFSSLQRSNLISTALGNRLTIN